MNQNLNKKVSIIIPAYNVEKYVGKFLEGVIEQTYKNMEILVVNDGSTDNTLQILNQYALRDKRIKVISQENRGISKARNVGMELAKGDYFIFFDADDFVPPDGVERLVEECELTRVDVAVANMKKIKNGKTVARLKEIKKVYEKEEALRELFNEKYINCGIWNKIFRKEIVENERFQEDIKIAEDFEFLYRVMKRVKKVAVNNEVTVYHYYVRKNSIMHGKFDQKFEKEVEICERILEETKKEYPSVMDAAIRRYQRAIVSCLSKCLKETGDTKQVAYLYDKLKNYPLKLEGYHKMKAYLLCHFKLGLKWIYKLYEKI